MKKTSRLAASRAGSRILSLLVSRSATRPACCPALGRPVVLPIRGAGQLVVGQVFDGGELFPPYDTAGASCDLIPTVSSIDWLFGREPLRGIGVESWEETQKVGGLRRCCNEPQERGGASTGDSKPLGRSGDVSSECRRRIDGDILNVLCFFFWKGRK